MRDRILSAAVLAAMLFCAPAAGETVAPDSPRWRLLGEQTRVVQHLGRTAIEFGDTGVAWLVDVGFETGVVEFDVAVDGQRAFPGLAFRIQDMGNYEHFYIRPHQSGNPDASQYTPVFDRATGWQIYYGTDYSAPTRYRLNEWIPVRIEVAADSARVFIDSDAPTLEIRDLKRERKPGSLALLSTGGSAHFSNFRFQPGDPADEPAPRAPLLPDGLVTAWWVSQSLPEVDAYAAASGQPHAELRWTRLDVESNGIVNLGRVAAWSAQAPAALARVVVRSDRARTVRVRFGFSDRARIYLNGAIVYDGDATFGSRDYRFLGTVGLHDAVHLPLREGDNEIILAVSEAFGGWAAMAAFEPTAGLQIGQD